MARSTHVVIETLFLQAAVVLTTKNALQVNLGSLFTCGYIDAISAGRFGAALHVCIETLNLQAENGSPYTYV